MRRVIEGKQAILLPVLLIGLTLWQLSPPGQVLEDTLGLGLLFSLRGERTSPPDVAVVAITENSADALQLPRQLSQWPRTPYARLTDTLDTLDARLIVFDIFFRGAGPDPMADRQFTRAIRRSGRTLLSAYNDRHITEIGGERLIRDRIQPPYGEFAAAALGTAPFVLPKVAPTYNHYWLRWDTDTPRLTLPAAALVHAAPSTQEQARIRRLLTALPDTLAYNFYGPPRSIPTLAIEDLLVTPERYRSLLEDAVVFVGYSARFQPGQQDGFSTPYSSDSGMDLSGVELAATAYANLRQNSYLRHDLLIWGAATLLFTALAFTIVTRLPPKARLPCLVVWAGAYLGLALSLFSYAALWLPVASPLLIGVPLTALYGGWHGLRMTQKQKQQLENAFGRYLPQREVQRLKHRPNTLPKKERLFGLCLATDAQGYTHLGEKLSPDKLSLVMERYYGAIITPIRSHDGLISDVAGDGIIAIWPHVEPERMWETLQPVLSDLRASVECFNCQHPETPLPTRIGVHAGEIVLGHFGASDHFQYRAVGDIVNTACRIENANKSLGTQVLFSEACRVPNNATVRYLGPCHLEGKRHPIGLYGLMEPPWNPELEARLASALDQWRRGQPERALQALKALHRETGDTPTRRLLEHYRSLSMTGHRR